MSDGEMWKQLLNCSWQTSLGCFPEAANEAAVKLAAGQSKKKQKKKRKGYFSLILDSEILHLVFS